MSFVVYVQIPPNGNKCSVSVVFFVFVRLLSSCIVFNCVKYFNCRKKKKCQQITKKNHNNKIATNIEVFFALIFRVRLKELCDCKFSASFHFLSIVWVYFVWECSIDQTFYGLFNKRNWLGNNLDNLLRRFLILCFVSFFFYFLAIFICVFSYSFLLFMLFLLRIGHYITKSSTTCWRLVRVSFFFFIPFCTVPSLFFAHAKFQRNFKCVVLQTTRKNVFVCVLCRAMLCCAAALWLSIIISVS